MEIKQIDNVETQNAYRAGKETGRVELILEMLEDLKKDREKYNHQAGFILSYLPERYRIGIRFLDLPGLGVMKND